MLILIMFSVCLYVFQLKCEKENVSLFFFSIILCSFKCIAIKMFNLLSNFDTQEPVSYGMLL